MQHVFMYLCIFSVISAILQRGIRIVQTAFEYSNIPIQPYAAVVNWESQFCPSVYPSVTRVPCDKTRQCTANISIPHERAITQSLNRKR